MEKDRLVNIISHGIDITDLYPDHFKQVKGIVPSGCPAEKVTVIFKYKSEHKNLWPVLYTAECKYVDKHSNICQHCPLNPNHTPLVFSQDK